MEQERIDVARATPVTSAEPASEARPRRRGMPLWLQLVISLLVIAAAAVIAALFNPTANALMARTGWTPPLLGGSADTASAPNAQGGTGSPTAAGGQGGGQNQYARNGQSGQAQPGQGGGAQTQTAAQPQGQGAPNGGPGGAGGGGRGGFGANRTAVVVTATATTAKINDKLSAIGEGSAVQSVTLTPSSSGTLVSVNVKPGDRVARGAAVASLDNASQQIAYDQAKLATANADAALARTSQLSRANSATGVELSTARLAADTAKLQLSNAELALSQRTITSPIDGTVGIIQVLPGNIVSGTSVVTTVEDASSILVNFWIPERYASQIKTGMPVAATSAALPGQQFTGTVNAVDNRVDAESRTLQVQATLPNGNNTIRPGMSFSVSMTFPGETFSAVDPLAVQWSSQGAYVWKVADGKVKKGMIEIVQRNSDGVLVKGDVKEGDQVVTQGVLQLSDGAAVRLLSDLGNNQNGSQAANGSSQGQAPGGNQNAAGGGQGGGGVPGGAGTAGQAGTGGTTGQTPTGNGTGPTGNGNGQPGSGRAGGGVGG